MSSYLMVIYAIYCINMHMSTLSIVLNFLLLFRGLRRVLVRDAQTRRKTPVQIALRNPVLEAIAYKLPLPFLATMPYRSCQTDLL